MTKGLKFYSGITKREKRKEKVFINADKHLSTRSTRFSIMLIPVLKDLIY